MKSNRLAVFAASLEYRVKGNSQISDVGGLGNLVVGVCRGERGPRGSKKDFTKIYQKRNL